MLELNELTIIDQRTVLEKNFTIYGNIETPLFLAKDVAEWIENRDTSSMIRVVDEDEKLIRSISVSGQRRDAWFLTEDGLYEVLMQSRKPIAKQFKKQVKLILKQIRQTGGYIPINSQDDEVIIMAKAHAILERTLKEKDNIIEAKTKALSIVQPKADIYDKLMNADGYFSFNVAAKELGIGRNKLMRLLRERGILFRDGLSNIAYQKYCNSGYFVVKHSIGKNGYACGVTKVTAKGLEYIHKVLNSSSSTMGVAK